MANPFSQMREVLDSLESRDFDIDTALSGLLKSQEAMEASLRTQSEALQALERDRSTFQQQSRDFFITVGNGYHEIISSLESQENAHSALVQQQQQLCSLSAQLQEKISSFLNRRGGKTRQGQVPGAPQPAQYLTQNSPEVSKTKGATNHGQTSPISRNSETSEYEDAQESSTPSENRVNGSNDSEILYSSDVEHQRRAGTCSPELVPPFELSRNPPILNTQADSSHESISSDVSPTLGPESDSSKASKRDHSVDHNSSDDISDDLSESVGLENANSKRQEKSTTRKVKVADISHKPELPLIKVTKELRRLMKPDWRQAGEPGKLDDFIRERIIQQRLKDTDRPVQDLGAKMETPSVRTQSGRLVRTRKYRAILSADLESPPSDSLPPDSQPPSHGRLTRTKRPKLSEPIEPESPPPFTPQPDGSQKTSTTPRKRPATKDAKMAPAKRPRDAKSKIIKPAPIWDRTTRSNQEAETLHDLQSTAKKAEHVGSSAPSKVRKSFRPSVEK